MDTTYEKLYKMYNYNENSGVFTDIQGNVIGKKHNEGYLALYKFNETILLHRLAWYFKYGSLPNGTIDHIDRDKTNNRIDNLRDATALEQSKNRDKRSDNTSGCTGVSWDKEKCMWRARIYIDKKCVSLGRFSEYHEAVNARKNAEALYGYTNG
jgi:hypothetical protein